MFPTIPETFNPLAAQSLLWTGSQEGSEEVNELDNVPSNHSILEQMKAIQMIDVHIPTTDGRQLKMSRHTKPDKAQQLLLSQLKLKLPPQPPPEISVGNLSSVVKTF